MKTIWRPLLRRAAAAARAGRRDSTSPRTAATPGLFPPARQARGAWRRRSFACNPTGTRRHRPVPRPLAKSPLIAAHGLPALRAIVKPAVRPLGRGHRRGGDTDRQPTADRSGRRAPETSISARYLDAVARATASGLIQIGLAGRKPQSTAAIVAGPGLRRMGSDEGRAAAQLGCMAAFVSASAADGRGTIARLDHHRRAGPYRLLEQRLPHRRGAAGGVQVPGGVRERTPPSGKRGAPRQGYPRIPRTPSAATRLRMVGAERRSDPGPRGSPESAPRSWWRRPRTASCRRHAAARRRARRGVSCASEQFRQLRRPHSDDERCAIHAELSCPPRPCSPAATTTTISSCRRPTRAHHLRRVHAQPAHRCGSRHAGRSAVLSHPPPRASACRWATASATGRARTPGDQRLHQFSPPPRPTPST